MHKELSGKSGTIYLVEIRKNEGLFHFGGEYQWYVAFSQKRIPGSKYLRSNGSWATNTVTHSDLYGKTLEELLQDPASFGYFRTKDDAHRVLEQLAQIPPYFDDILKKVSEGSGKRVMDFDAEQKRAIFRRMVRRSCFETVFWASWGRIYCV
jgi:hypothetical protein